MTVEVDVLQWGHDFSVMEREFVYKPVNDWIVELQWGHDFSVMERKEICQTPAMSWEASMGP